MELQAWIQIRFSVDLEDTLDILDTLKNESRTGAVRSQTVTWIRFRKDRELVELAFSSRMVNIYSK